MDANRLQARNAFAVRVLPAVTRYLHRNARQDADDLTQITMCRILLLLDRDGFAAIDSPEGWAVSVAKYVMLDAGRGRRLLTFSALESEEKAFDPAEKPVPVAASDATPPAVVNRVQAALTRLKPASRKLITARYMTGLGTMEVAAAFGETKRGIAGRIAAAVRECREQMGLAGIAGNEP